MMKEEKEVSVKEEEEGEDRMRRKERIKGKTVFPLVLDFRLQVISVL